MSSSILECEKAITYSGQSQSTNLIKGYSALMHSKIGDFEKTQQLLHELKTEQEKDKLYIGFYLLIPGLVYYENEEYDSALVYLIKANRKALYFNYVSQHIDMSFMASLYLGRSYFAIGQYDKSIAAYHNALLQHSQLKAYNGGDAVRAHYWLGLAFEKNEQYDSAIIRYETFLDIWKNADSGIVEIEDAKERLVKLKNQI